MIHILMASEDGLIARIFSTDFLFSDPAERRLSQQTALSGKVIVFDWGVPDSRQLTIEGETDVENFYLLKEIKESEFSALVGFNNTLYKGVINTLAGSPSGKLIKINIGFFSLSSKVMVV